MEEFKFTGDMRKGDFKFSDVFTVTPKPRELTEKEIDNFGLRYYGGKEIKPAYEDTDNVWAAANTGSLPTYRFYDCGTNCLLVLRYTPDKDVWEKIELSDIGNLYGFIWKICLKLMRYRNE